MSKGIKKIILTDPDGVPLSSGVAGSNLGIDKAVPVNPDGIFTPPSGTTLTDYTKSVTDNGDGTLEIINVVAGVEQAPITTSGNLGRYAEFSNILGNGTNSVSASIVVPFDSFYYLNIGYDYDIGTSASNSLTVELLVNSTPILTKTYSIRGDASPDSFISKKRIPLNQNDTVQVTLTGVVGSTINDFDGSIN